jgi:DNA replicative helicase MCM subunit Mcm2 (Cdc46/Mcm family)
MIRLSTAIAKARLSNAVSVDDAEEAYSLMHFACFKEVTLKYHNFVFNNVCYYLETT